MTGLAVVIVGAATGLAVMQADGRYTKRDAETLRQKVATISEHAEKNVRQPRRTTITENEVNSYLVFDAPQQLPTGVVEPSVAILGPGRLSGRAVVDLDGVRKARASSSLFDPTNYLTGRVPVTATGTLKTSEGMGWFQLESATVGGVPVPKLLLQEIVSYYSRTAEKPSGIGLDDPFALPARIREIQVDRGQAIIVQ
ncbi:MAG TPA: hypothetical protein VH497_18800 [Vicinamibacterales bacterium]